MRLHAECTHVAQGPKVLVGIIGGGNCGNSKVRGAEPARGGCQAGTRQRLDTLVKPSAGTEKIKHPPTEDRVRTAVPYLPTGSTGVSDGKNSYADVWLSKP